MERKKQQRRESDRAPISHVTTKAELIELKRAADARQREAEQDLKAELRELKRFAEEKAKRSASRKKAGKRLDTRVGRKRDNNDYIGPFELELLRHGLNFDDLRDASRQFEAGTRTPYARLGHAALRWWMAQPMGQRRCYWVDPASGFTKATVPKLSTIEGKRLIELGLVGGGWAYTRSELLAHRAREKRMLELTPEERLREPWVPGDFRQYLDDK